MNHCDTHDSSETLRSDWYHRTAARPRDRHNLPKPKWSAMIKALLGPAVRLHGYRNMRTAMFYDAVHDLDRCK